MSKTSIMSVREMIDVAFGESDVNVVNFKLFQTILFILAKQLRLLERRVEIQYGPLPPDLPMTTLSITEIKMQAMVPKKRAKGTKSKGESKPESGKTEGRSAKSSKTRAAGGKSDGDESSSHEISIVKDGKRKGDDSKSTSYKVTSTDTFSQEKPFTKDMKRPDEQKSKDRSPSKESKKTIEDDVSQHKSTPKDTKKSTNQTKETVLAGQVGKGDKQLKPGRPEAYRDLAHETVSIKKGKLKPVEALENFEQLREQEIRVIHQRANSKEDPDLQPEPMASGSSTELKREKLLLVERISSRESTEPGRTRSLNDTRIPRLSIVTREEFLKLFEMVMKLEDKFGVHTKPEFPENEQLMQELRKGASLTDAMAALQLSARIEASEKTLNEVIGLVSELAANVPGFKKPKDTTEEDEIKEKTETETPEDDAEVGQTTSQISKLTVKTLKQEDIVSEKREKVKEKKIDVTVSEIDDALEEIYGSVLKEISASNAKTNEIANHALKIAKHLEEKLNSSFYLGNRMEDLETLFNEYTSRINQIDSSLSSQMTDYQDQLTQMQHELEMGIETMAESLATTGGDPVAVAELNAKFTNLQIDLDNAFTSQRELEDTQNRFSDDLKYLWTQIEMIKGTKSDRDEVVDALRDKAGISALNGLVRLDQFDAVRGDFEKRISTSYDKFNSQEIVWQKAIDDLVRELNEKVDMVQLIALRDDINSNLSKVYQRVQDLSDIVGKPRASAVTKKIVRDTDCLSCSSPADLNTHAEPIPLLPKSKAKGDEAESPSHPKDDGDHKVCYPGHVITHEIDPRAHYCRRYCGGSHTTTAIQRAPTAMGLTLQQLERRMSTVVGTDGKLYHAEELVEKKPCKQCNEPEHSAPQVFRDSIMSENENAFMKKSDSNMTPADYQQDTEIVRVMSEIPSNGDSMMPLDE